MWKSECKAKALVRIVPFMDLEKKKILINAFFNAQFSYCPLTWMFHSRNLNSKINRMDEKCLRIVYNMTIHHHIKSFLEIDNSVSVHHKNIQILATELYKIVNGLSPDIMSFL